VSVATIRNTEYGIGRRSRHTLEDLSKAFGESKNYLRKILVGQRPPDKAEDAAAEPAPQAFLDMLDDILVKRLRELVVPHLNQIEHQLHVRPDIMYRTSPAAEVRVDSTHEAQPREDSSRPGES
jgi:hypothetical protein